MLPAVCISLSEVPIASEKLGQWADEIGDAADWELLQAVFSKILQSSGQNVYCQPDVLSAALNFDWGEHTFLYSPLLFHTRLCWELFSWEASE